MSEPRQSSALAIFRLSSTQGNVPTNLSSSHGKEASSEHSFSTQLSSATERSRRSVAQSDASESRTRSDRANDARSARKPIEDHDSPSHSSGKLRQSERSDAASESTGSHSGQSGSTRSDSASGSTSRRVRSEEAGADVQARDGGEKSAASALDFEGSIAATGVGLAQSGLEQMESGQKGLEQIGLENGEENGVVVADAVGSGEIQSASGNSSLALIDGIEENDTSPPMETQRLITADPASSSNGATATLPANGLAQAQQASLVNSAGLDGVSSPASGVSALRGSPVGDVISQANLASHYRYLANSSGTGSDERSGSLAKGSPVLTDQSNSLRLAGSGALGVSEALSGSADLLKPGTSKGEVSLQPAVAGGGTDKSLSDTLSGVLKEQGRTTNIAAGEEKDMSGSSIALSQRMMQMNAQKLAAMNEEATLQRNLLTQNATPALNVALSDAASNSSGQSAENMFLSATGGIVTAPLQARQSTDSILTMNAPHNVALLSEGADDAMVSNIRWMAGEGVKNAVVNVTPSGMGPISVQIGIDKEQMNVSIIAVQGSTREALDSMLPRLREQLMAQGHDSVRVDISDGRSEQSRNGNGQHFNNAQSHTFFDSEERNNAVSRDGGDSLVTSENQPTDRSGLQESGTYTHSNTKRYDLYV